MLLSIKKSPPIQRQRSTMLEIENSLLLISGIQQENLETGDLFISETEFIHFTKVSKTKPIHSKHKNNILLMLHGYGGFGATFYKLIEKLSSHFYIILIDLPGFGFSSRVDSPPFNSIETCIEFFVGRIKLFVEKLGFERVNLVGHSLGAYLSAHFFKRNRKMVKRLFLLSPAGMNFPFEDQKQRIMRLFEKKNALTKFLAKKFFDKIFEQKRSPFEFAFWPLKKMAISAYLKNERFGFSQQEVNLLAKLQDYFIGLPQCGEYSICYLMYYGPKSKKPIMDVLCEMRNRASTIFILYGEFDSMDKEMTKSFLQKKGIDVKMILVKNSDHQLLFQNCEEIKIFISSECKILAKFSSNEE